MKFFDTHAHYNDERFEEIRYELIDSLYSNNVIGIVCAGYSVESSVKAIEISKKYEQMWSTCGISPNDLPEDVESFNKNLLEIERLSENDKVVAIGEIGLDYYWNKENKEYQRDCFIKQVQLANKLDLPIVIHSRDAVSDTLDILKKNTVKQRGIFHCCQLNVELVKEAVKLGFYISLAGPITFKNSKNADEVIKLIPLDKILIETDSPFLAPEPVRGTTNNSGNVQFMAEKIANVKEISLEEISKITTENACRIFRVKV